MRDHISITGAGNLKCKKIIHINAPGHDQKDWKERIVQCLKLAEDNHLKSIALPAVGTGKQNNLEFSEKQNVFYVIFVNC